MNFANLRKIQSSMGVCLQRDVYWPSMTVEEHLELFLRLRGERINSKTIVDEIKMFDLVPDQKAESLSGGQKRKLNIAIALVGEPQLVILDEPTAGVSVNAQLQIANILREFQIRSSRSTVLLTTHDLDEAESLAKDVIVIRKGQLQIQGSPDDLSKQFNCGYTVEVPMTEDVKTAKHLILKSFPDAKFSENARKSLLVCKCGADISSTIVPTMCTTLDSARIAFRLRVGSLKDVFLELVDA